MSAITTHVLDAALGRPAVGVPVRLELPGDPSDDSAARLIASGTTDSDGRVAELGPDRAEPGTYRLTFGTGAYFEGTGQTGFYPEVSITFVLTDSAQHYHVPLLLSPFAYSTYRGS